MTTHPAPAAKPGRARYQAPLRSTWFMGRYGYRRFMVREGTSFAVAAFLVWLLFLLNGIGEGYSAWAGMMELARHPMVLALHAVIFGAVMYHAFTWFNLTPKIVPMYVAEEKVPDAWAAIIMGYLPWAAVTAVVLWGVLRLVEGGAA